MGFDQKLKDLLKLQTTQPDAFTAKLDEPWPGMQSDIELALGILLEYQGQGKPASSRNSVPCSMRTRLDTGS